VGSGIDTETENDRPQLRWGVFFYQHLYSAICDYDKDAVPGGRQGSSVILNGSVVVWGEQLRWVCVGSRGISLSPDRIRHCSAAVTTQFDTQE
jgi:hypothetical protein